MNTKIKTGTDVLRAAKQLLIDVGWVKNQSYKTDGHGKKTAYCASGAVGFTGGSNDFKARLRAHARLNKVAGKKFHFSIVSLNDHPHTSKKQVLAAFDRAINSTKRKKGSKR